MAAVSYYYYITRLLGIELIDLNQTSHINKASLKGLHSLFEIFKMAAVSYYMYTYITRLLGIGWTDLHQTSQINRASLKGMHSTFEILQMAAISKWPPFLTITILPDFSEMN
jgi:hypothetical protein